MTLGECTLENTGPSPGVWVLFDQSNQLVPGTNWMGPFRQRFLLGTKCLNGHNFFKTLKTLLLIKPLRMHLRSKNKEN